MTSNVSCWRWWWLRPQFRDEPLDPDKHGVLLERIAGQLRVNGRRHPTDDDVAAAVARRCAGCCRSV
jgi:hypothetical protein